MEITLVCMPRGHKWAGKFTDWCECMWQREPAYGYEDRLSGQDTWHLETKPAPLSWMLLCSQVFLLPASSTFGLFFILCYKPDKKELYPLLSVCAGFVFTFSDWLEVLNSLHTWLSPGLQPLLERSGVGRWIDALRMRFEIEQREDIYCACGEEPDYEYECVCVRVSEWKSVSKWLN